MLNDLFRALRQLADPPVARILAKAVATTAALLLALVALAAGLTQALVATGIAWLDPLLPWFSGLGALVAAVLLTPLATMSVLGLFVDEVADAVEARHYPAWPRARAIGLVEGAMQSLRILGLAALLNLLALPLYLLLPALNLAIYLGLNGWLLGREYFVAVAQRRASPAELAHLRRQNRGRITLAGAMLALIALVPILNLTLPVVGTALMVHRFAAMTSARC